MIAQILQAYSPYVLLFLTSLLGWIGWSLRSKFTTKIVFDNLCQRVQKIEDKMEEIPTKQDLHQISINMEKMSGDLNTQKNILMRVERTMERQEEFLLNRGQK